MKHRTRRRYWIPLLAIVLMGFGLRVWYGAESPRIDRFEDEKYSLLNIRSIVTEGTLEPASSYYPYPFFNIPPAGLVAGSDVLYRRTGDPRFETLRENGFGAATFLLTRLVQTLYGTLALFLIYLVGREVFSPTVGLIAAATLAFMPWHIHASGYFKPDAQLVAMVLLAFYWSVKAVELPSWKSYLLTGVGIALAMSTKMTGGLIAIPIVVGTLASGWRDKRRIGLLAFSAVTSAGLFVLLNPYWRFYPVWLSGLERDYAMRAARQGMTRWQVPGRVGELITDPYTLGPWLGTLALAAFFVLAVRLLPSSRAIAGERTRIWMFLSFPLVYAAAYAWKTPYFKDNNFLPVIPFFCLATGWALVELWQLAEKAWPELAKNPWRIAGALLLLLVIPLPGLTYTYRTTTPTTLDRALTFLGRKMRPATGRLVLIEEMPIERPVWEGGRRFGRGRSRIESVEAWQEIPESRLDLVDAAVLLATESERISIDRGSWQDVRAFEPRLFRVRGPALAAAVHNWRRMGPPTALPIRKCRPNRRCFSADLPTEAAEAERITLVVTLGFAWGESVEDVVAIRVGPREVPLLLASRHERGAVFMTEKFPPPEGPTTAVFVARKQLLRQRQFGIELHRWRKVGG